MNTSKEGVSGQINISPLEAFTGTIVPAKTGPLYKAGLAIVAFAMVLLPLIYITLIVLAGWLVFLHLTKDTWIFDGASGRAGLYRLILYLGPVVAGGILIFFMIKPFFAAKVKSPEAIRLDPSKEPLLFAFVQKICHLVGAKAPSRIDVDCQVNASASFRKGLLSRDLVLTIGLPLASGLDMRQFAGVLAHEFGHFAQGAGMRLTYIIRKINFWFARVVYERDQWDVKLDESARGADWRIAIVLHMGRGCVWVTRRILWALMHAGHAISCFMLRQMEYDADCYEAKVAGSDAFELTATRLRVLHVATQNAYEDVRQSWATNRLPESLPLLIDHKANCLPSEIHEKLSASAASQKTGWFDTHPCDADRVRAARQRMEPGVFRLTQPATQLFSDFAELSKTVTRHQYKEHFELEFTDQNLMSAEEILRESTASAKADAMIRQYYGDVNVGLKPLLINWECTVTSGDDALLKSSASPDAMQSVRAAAERTSNECVQLQQRLIDLTCAQYLTEAGFRVNKKEFGLPDNAQSPGEQNLVTQEIMKTCHKAKADLLNELEPFMSALRERVSRALRAAQKSQGALTSESADELSRLGPLLVALGAQLPAAHELGMKMRAFTLLLHNGSNGTEEGSKVMSKIVTELQGLVSGIQAQLKAFEYPFPHARGQLTVAQFLSSDKAGENVWHQTFLDSDSHLTRLFALNYRLIGRVLELANAAETVQQSV